jgi:hypothetical protein
MCNKVAVGIEGGFRKGASLEVANPLIPLGMEFVSISFPIIFILKIQIPTFTHSSKSHSFVNSLTYISIAIANETLQHIHSSICNICLQNVAL